MLVNFAPELKVGINRNKTKIDMSSEFELSDDIDKLESEYRFDVYVPKTDREYLEHASITRVVVADHT